MSNITSHTPFNIAGVREIMQSNGLYDKVYWFFTGKEHHENIAVKQLLTYSVSLLHFALVRIVVCRYILR